MAQSDVDLGLILLCSIIIQIVWFNVYNKTEKKDFPHPFSGVFIPFIIVLPFIIVIVWEILI